MRVQQRNQGALLCHSIDETVEGYREIRERRGDWQIESWVLIQDLVFEFLRFARWFQAELLDERGPELVVRPQCRGDTIGSVERKHERSPDEFAVRVLHRQPFEVGNDLAMVTQGELGLHQSLDGQQVEFDQSCELAGARRSIGEVVEWCALPASQRLTKRSSSGPGLVLFQQ